MRFNLCKRTISGLLGLLFLQVHLLSASSFTVLEIEGDVNFPEGAEKGAMKFIGAENKENLAAIFKAQGLPFDPDLVRNKGGQKYHIWYEPTLKGFKADTENDQIQGLMFDIDTLSYLSGRAEVVGDSLDVVKEILSHIHRPLNITLGVNHALENEWYQDALKFHFKDLPHSIKFNETTSPVSNPWVQDYIKSGMANGKPYVMIPRRLLEGSSEYGEKFRPFLDELVNESYVRSNLSWEGGDIQFLKHPRNPSETIIFFGDTAKQYWGAELTDEEYAYVLKLEFGADHAVNLSGLAPHIDYFVSFIPEENIALVSNPITGSQGLAYSALEALGQRLKTPYTNEILDMAKTLSVSAYDFRKSRKKVRASMDLLKKTQGELPIEEKIGMKERLEAYISQNCSENPDACFTGEGRQKMFEIDLPLLRDWVSSAAVLRTDVAQIPALLSVIESQLPDYKIPEKKLREQKIAELEGLGLKVIRVPMVAGDKSLQIPWSGISYVNNILVDNILFIPVMGLTKIEKMIIDDLKFQLPREYKIVPIYARHLILNNGGVHCATGIIRGL
jgi:Porphyromonas-type peptidyl-arginine deiminase